MDRCAHRVSGVLLVGLAGLLSLTANDCFGDPADQISDKQLAKIRARAEQGHIPEEIQLAAAYLSGDGVAQDDAQAARWYLKAAESGDPEAQNQIGYFYQSGIGLPVDFERAAHWFQLASASGMGWAKVNLGVSYLHGEGVRQNVSTARQLFLEGLDRGVGLGATYLGVMAYFGVGAPVDKAAAVRWFESGVKLHDPEAAYDLAVLVCQGEGEGRDLRRASELLRFSAGKGLVAGKHALGLLLVNHSEYAHSEQEARVALEEASDAGNSKSSILLGILERKGGNGSAPDCSRAFYYFSLGALQGGEEGNRMVGPDVAALQKKLTTEQRATLTAQATARFREHPIPLKFVLKTSTSKRNFPLIAATDPAPGP